TWSRTSSCRCGSEQFIQKENFPEFTYRLFVLWNRVIYTKLLTHPLQQANKVLHIEWFLYLPSIYGFAVFDAYINAVKNNKLFAKEQRFFLKDNYQHPNFQILKNQMME